MNYDTWQMMENPHTNGGPVHEKACNQQEPIHGKVEDQNNNQPM